MVDQVARYLEPQLREGLRSSRVVALLGARQVGKSTLARMLFGEGRVYSLDDATLQAAALRDPGAFVAGLGSGAVIDEVQLAPQLLLAIKRAVDRNDTPGQFVVTGSADLLFLPTVADSLAGRVQYYELMPFAQAELTCTTFNVVEGLLDPRRFSELSCEPAGIIDRVVAGGYPESVRREEPARDAWFASYITSIVRRDVRDITQIEDIATMERFLRLVGAWSGKILNQSRLASELGISPTTVRRYLTLLEWIFIVHSVPAWSGDPGRRLVKAPKIFMNDSGLAAYLQYQTRERLDDNRMALGALLETFVHSELRKHGSWTPLRPNFYHWRDHATHQELDLLLETRDGKRVGVEIKATATLDSKDYATLLKLMGDRRLNLHAGIVFYTGESVAPLGHNVFAVPVSVFWSSSR